MVLYVVLKVAFLVEISIFNRSSNDKVLWQKLLLAQSFFLYFPFMTMCMSVECLLRLQRSHSSTKSLWFPLGCINFWTSMEFFL